MGAEIFEFSILDEIKPKETSTPIEIKNELKDFISLYRNDLALNKVLLY